MSAVNNQNNSNTRYPKRVTDYSKNMFQGVTYPSQDEAVMAGAKHHAKLDWATIEVINELEKTKITPQMLLDAKVELINRSIAKRDETPNEFR